ncbi:hypothetical protein TYRP_009301 [Tyrophagus putrescentiae]|nr:hypothetical protein TYRP_009301 [Tyrophagus putrescentiae]
MVLCLSSEEGGEAVVEEEGVELPELELEEEEELQEELSCEVLECLRADNLRVNDAQDKGHGNGHQHLGGRHLGVV